MKENAVEMNGKIEALSTEINIIFKPTGKFLGQTDNIRNFKIH